MVIRASGGGGGGTGGEAAGAAQFSQGASPAGGGMVYMGTVPAITGKNPDYLTPAAEAQLSRQKTDLWVHESEAVNDFFNWSVKQQRDFIAQDILSGRLKLGDGIEEAAADWKKLVTLSAKFGAAGKKVSPLDLLASYTQASGGANSWHQAGVWEVNTQTGERRYTGPGKYLGAGKAVQTDTRVDLTDPDTARAISTKLFQDLMGRDPGAGELGAFASALHEAEASSPVTQSTTTQYDMTTGQSLSSATQSSGGMTAEGRAYLGEQQIKKKKEYGAYQAATTYQNALESLVFGGPAA